MSSILVTSQAPISNLQVYSGPDLHNQTAVILFAIGSGTNVSFSVDFGTGLTPSTGIVPGLMNVSVSHYYPNPGPYNVTVSVFNIVGPSISKTITIFVAEACRVESVLLHGVSPDPQLSQNIGEMDKVFCAARYVINCSSPLELQFHWSITNVASDMHENVQWSTENTHNSARASFPAKKLVVGRYKVKVSTVMPNGTVLVREGFFTRVSTNFVVACSCGNTRTVSMSEAFSLSATVVSKTSAVSGNLSYEWFCSQSYGIKCFGDVIPRNTSVIQFPRNFFTSPQIYDFVVKVKDGENTGICSQEVIIGYDETTLKLCLR